jgi:hypothetical protein
MSLLSSIACGWAPGPAVPAPLSNLTVDGNDRSDVISFYQNIYKASENYASVINWSGNIGNCNEGTFSGAFVDLMRRRVNYYRAMAGVPASIQMNDNSTVMTIGDSYDADPATLKSFAAQKGALIISRNNLLTHTPPTNVPCFSNAGGNGCLFGNVAIGIYGPPALDFYMKEDVNNQEAGHRRWMLFDGATNFATGDIPRSGTNASANTLYINQRPEEIATVDPRFIPWPPAGYCPWQHATEYLSLSYPGAGFAHATISVSRNGVAQTVDQINRTQGFGNNGIVWRVPSIMTDANTNEDAIYDVTVSNISGGGPTSYSYSIHFINADYLPTPPALNGITTVAPGGSRNFTITPVDIAEEYRLEVGKKSALPTTTLEGAEDATAAFVIPGPVTGTGYNVRSTTYKLTGLKSLNLAFTEVSQQEQWIELDRVLLPKSAASISYFRRISYMNSSTTFVAQYSLNNDGRWKDIPGTAKAGTSAMSGTIRETESAFTSKLTFNLPAETINQPTRIRLLIRKNAPQAFITNATSPSGAFIDDISFTNVDWLSTRRLTNYPLNSTTVTLNASTAGETLAAGSSYTLRLQPRVGNTWMTASPLMEVAVSSNMQPTLDPIAGPINLLEDDDTQSIPLTGISAGLDEIQTLTVTATSSNPTLIPNPTISYSSPHPTGTLLLKPAPNQSGSATITVTVNDGQTSNQTISRSFLVQVAAVNDAPSITAISDRTINEDSNTGAIAFTIADVDHALSALSVSVTSDNPTLTPQSGMVLTGTTASRTLTITPAANRWGISLISLKVTDGTVITTRNFLLTVNAVNDAPTLATLTNRSIPEDSPTQSVNLTGISPGPFEDQSLTVTATSSNPNIIPHPVVQYTSPSEQGILQFTPQPNATGLVTITVRVDDGQSGNNVITRTFTVTVTAVNDRPVIATIAPRTIDEDTSTGVIAFTVSDIETAATSLKLTRVSVNTTLFPLANVLLGGSGSNRTVTVKPAANQFGSGEIRITVSDGVLSATSSFLVHVLPVNDAPTLATITNPAAINEDSGQQTVNLSGIGRGASNEIQTLTITATSSNTALIPHPTVVYTSPNATGSLRYTPVPNAFGSAVITVTVNDGESINATFSRTFTVSVKNVNDRPTIAAIPPRIMVQNTTSPPIPFVVDDLETAAGSLTVTRASSNTTLLPLTGIVLGGSGANRTVTLTPAPNRTGTANVTLTVSDGALTAQRIFSLTVNAQNQAPTITAIPSQNILQDQSTAALPFTIGDPEDLIQQLNVSTISNNQTLLPPEGIVISGSGTQRFITLTPASGQAGTATVTVVVNDGLSVASTSFTLTVEAVIQESFESVIGEEYPELSGAEFQHDFDDDGIPNGVEYAFHLDPTQPNTLKGFALHPETATMRLSVPLLSPRADISYGAEYSDDLKIWHSEDVVLTHENDVLTATCPMSGKSRYMRWKITKN